MYESVIRLKDRIVITSNGEYPTSVFQSRFSPDRYGKEAINKANAYGRSLYGKLIEVDNNKYRIKGHELMMGACDYVGSLLFLVEEEVKAYIRKDDGERFTSNGDGTYSSDYMKENYPENLHHKWPESSFLNEYFKEEATCTKI